MPIRLHIDSTAALSIISKTGLGKAKHVDIQHLWAPGGGPQQQVEGGNGQKSEKGEIHRPLRVREFMQAPGSPAPRA